MKIKSLSFLACIALFVQCSTPKQPLEMPLLFSDNMVLQSEVEVPIWGKATPGTTVEVVFREQRIASKVDNDGKWIIKLQPETPGSNESLAVICNADTIVLSSISVGEVWIASGQSNMEMPMICNWAKVDNIEEEIANANYPDIKMFTVKKNTAVLPIDTMAASGWISCSSQTVGDFSATAYFFARDLYQKLNVPIGIIFTAWGGTDAEAWTSAEALSAIDRYVESVNKVKSMPTDPAEELLAFEKDDSIRSLQMAEADLGIENGDSIFTRNDFDDSQWDTIVIPSLWEANPTFGAFDGSMWFRKKINIDNASIINEEVILSVAPPDDYDEAWINGVKVGECGKWGIVRKYPVPKGLLKVGENLITLRVSDFQGAGGFNGTADDMALELNDWKLNLSGQWLCKKGYDMNDIEMRPMKPGDPNRPSVLYNAMINPLIPYAFKGIIWYQGENNTGKAYDYRELFSSLITDWRNKWDVGDFPFFFVQLAAHLPRNAQPIDDSWAELREAQKLALNLPNTGMAVTIDIGDANNIHPSNKQDVGRRLSLLALNKVYGFDMAYSGPTFKDMQISGKEVIINFEQTFDGLKTSDGGKVTGFAIAGADQKFYWANAKIEGVDKISLTSKEVKNPVAVRYAWSSNPECNLINSEGLPASPFRTDDWKLITER